MLAHYGDPITKYALRLQIFFAAEYLYDCWLLESQHTGGRLLVHPLYRCHHNVQLRIARIEGSQQHTISLVRMSGQQGFIGTNRITPFAEV